MLFREELREKVHVVHKDKDARYMWVRICMEQSRDVYIVVCYFAPIHSRYTSQGDSPYMPLYEDITRFSNMGDILLIGDFNGHTRNMQSTTYDTGEPMYKEITMDETSAQRVVQDLAKITEYGEHFHTKGTLVQHSRHLSNSLRKETPNAGMLKCALGWLYTD